MGESQVGAGGGGSRNHKAKGVCSPAGSSALPSKVVVPASETAWKCQCDLGHRDIGGHGWTGPWSSFISPQGPPFLGPAGPAEAWECVPMLDPHSAGKPALLTSHLDGNEGDAWVVCSTVNTRVTPPSTACGAPRRASYRLVALGAPCSQAEEAAHCGPAWFPFSWPPSPLRGQRCRPFSCWTLPRVKAYRTCWPQGEVPSHTLQAPLSTCFQSPQLSQGTGIREGEEIVRDLG